MKWGVVSISRSETNLDTLRQIRTKVIEPLQEAYPITSREY